MASTSVRPGDDIQQTLEKYGDMLYRLCLIMLKNRSDAEDAVQETLIRLYRKAPVFTDDEHEKAWLIRVATNKCRDMLRYRARHPQSEAEALEKLCSDSPDSGILEALTALPDKYRIVLTLHYVQQCTTTEIARIIGRTPSAVKMRLQKGRKLLEETYRKEYME